MSVARLSKQYTAEVPEEQLPPSDALSYFSSRPWLSSWQACYCHSGDRLLPLHHNFVLPNQRSLTVWTPWMIRVRPILGLPVRVLRFMGTGDNERDEVATEFSDIHADQPLEEDILTELFNWLREQKGWDICYFENILPSSSIARMLDHPGVFRKLAGWRYSITIKNSFEDWVASLGPSTRSKVRRTLRVLDGPDWSVELYHSRDGLGLALEQLAKLHQSRWRERGHPGVFSSGRFVAFQRNLLARPDSGGVIALLRHGEKVYAGWYGFDHQGTRYFYQGGFEPSATNFSPGLALHLWAIRDAFAKELSRYDFMKGAPVSYKQHYATDRTPVFHYLLPGQTLRGLLCGLAVGWANHWREPGGR